MGEKITITAIEILIQDRPDLNLNRILLQFDFEYEESKRKERMFIDIQDFFKLLMQNNKGE